MPRTDAIDADDDHLAPVRVRAALARGLTVLAPSVPLLRAHGGGILCEHATDGNRRRAVRAAAVTPRGQAARERAAVPRRGSGRDAALRERAPARKSDGATPW